MKIFINVIEAELSISKERSFTIPKKLYNTTWCPNTKMNHMWLEKLLLSMHLGRQSFQESKINFCTISFTLCYQKFLVAIPKVRNTSSWSVSPSGFPFQCRSRTSLVLALSLSTLSHSIALCQRARTGLVIIPMNDRLTRDNNHRQNSFESCLPARPWLLGV